MFSSFWFFNKITGAMVANECRASSIRMIGIIWSQFRIFNRSNNHWSRYPTCQNMKATPFVQRTSLICLCSMSLFGIPDKGKQTNMCKIEEGYYAVIREKTETVDGKTWQTHWLNFEDGWDAHPVFNSYNLDSLEKVTL